MPLPPGYALVVCGAANWQRQDRYLAPEAIAPLQVITAEGIWRCPWFDRHRDVGVSSLVPEAGGEWVVYTSGSDLVRLRLSDGSIDALGVPDLHDVHELTKTDHGVLVANTGRDEALDVDLASGRVRQRYDLAPLRLRGRPNRLAGGGGVASFHLNQVFCDQDRLLGLVHHIEGFRLFSHAQRRLTGHGSGGVLDLQTGWRRDLRLYAPHTVRRYGDGWLVLNSGRKELLLLTPDWEVREVLDLRGWGRGGAMAHDREIFYAGISGIRRRYARPGDSLWTGVEAVDLAGRERWSLQLTDIEQVNAVELCPVRVAEALAGLPGAVRAVSSGGHSSSSG